MTEEENTTSGTVICAPQNPFSGLNTAQGYMAACNGVSCVCNRDFTPAEMLRIIYELRDKTNFKTHREKFFDLGSEFMSSLRTNNLSIDKGKVSLFTERINSMFFNYRINTCRRKIHSLAQMYVETASFRSTSENISSLCSNYEGGCDFRGRGMKQITHDYNYLKYYDFTTNNNYSQVYDNLRGSKTGVPVSDYLDKEDPITKRTITTLFYNQTLKPFTKRLAQDPFYAFDSAGWFVSVHRPRVLNAMDNGLSSTDVENVSRLINGGTNGLADRINRTQILDDFFSNCNNFSAIL